MNQYLPNLGMLLLSVLKNYPNNDAICYENRSYSFSEICSIVTDWANFFKTQATFSCRPIAIKSDKSVNSYCAVLASNILGIAYAHLDPKSPTERERYIVETLKPSLVLNFVDNTFESLDTGVVEKLPDFSQNSVHEESYLFERINALSKESHGETIAYIMFTSGSTGRPKGVAISQASLMNFISWVRTNYHIGCQDVFSGLNQSHFDNSIFDLYGSVYNGAALVPITSIELKFPSKVLDKLRKLHTTVWFSVPSYLVYCLKLKAITAERTVGIKAVIFGGEGFPKANLKKLRETLSGATRMYNVYGPTEATCICSSYEITDRDLLDLTSLAPLGNLAPNFGYKIVNKNEDGVGELILIGPQVAQGYIGDQKLTNERFKFVNQEGLFEKSYNTGDLVKLRNDMLHFMGRADNQVKHMGYRIELEEIESYFQSSPFIIECIVTHNAKSGDLSRLKLHLVCSLDEVEMESILNGIIKNLPLYMRPSEIHFYSVLPKNSNGKIDRKVLADEV